MPSIVSSLLHNILFYILSYLELFLSTSQSSNLFMRGKLSICLVKHVAVVLAHLLFAMLLLSLRASRLHSLYGLFFLFLLLFLLHSCKCCCCCCGCRCCCCRLLSRFINNRISFRRLMSKWNYFNYISNETSTATADVACSLPPTLSRSLSLFLSVVAVFKLSFSSYLHSLGRVWDAA